MKHLLYRALVITSLSIPALSYAADQVETYKIDPMHTYVLWHIKHLGYSIQAGKFVMVDGTVTLDETKPQNSKVNATIHTGEVVTGIPKLDEHLKGDQFFNITEFPEASFTSHTIQMTGKDKGKITGMLTLHGVTKPIVLEVKMEKMGMNPMTNKKTVGFTATTTLKRSDFGMNAYLPNLGDEVKIEIGAEANLAE